MFGAFYLNNSTEGVLQFVRKVRKLYSNHFSHTLFFFQTFRSLSFSISEPLLGNIPRQSALRFPAQIVGAFHCIPSQHWFQNPSFPLFLLLQGNNILIGGPHPSDFPERRLQLPVESQSASECLCRSKFPVQYPKPLRSQRFSGRLFGEAVRSGAHRLHSRSGRCG